MAQVQSQLENLGNSIVEMKRINPWQYQKIYGISHAIEVSHTQRILYCTGQTSVDDEGDPVYQNDMPAQIEQALNNLETVLNEADMSFTNVVRLICFTTDVAAYNAASDVLIRRLKEVDCQPASTLIEVAGLFHPDVMIELEATAVA